MKQLVFDLMSTAAEWNGSASGSVAAAADGDGDRLSVHNERRHMQQMASLDAIYQKKVMWMRALNAEHLGIRSEYWMPSEVVAADGGGGDGGGGGNVSDGDGDGDGGASSLVMRAGKDIPFAESINLMGQLEADYFVVAQYEESVRENRKSRMRAKVLLAERVSVIDGD